MDQAGDAAPVKVAQRFLLAQHGDKSEIILYVGLGPLHAGVKMGFDLEDFDKILVQGIQ